MRREWPSGSTFGPSSMGAMEVRSGDQLEALGVRWELPLGREVDIDLYRNRYDINMDGVEDIWFRYGEGATRTVEHDELHVIDGLHRGVIDPGTDADWRFVLPPGHRFLAWSMGDFNGDQQMDLHVGLGTLDNPDDPIASTYQHRVEVYHGPFAPGVHVLDSPDVVVDFEGVPDSWASSERRTLDVNLDGLDDLIVTTEEDGIEAVLLFLSPLSGSMTAADATARIELASRHRTVSYLANFGWPIAAGADFDGDGIGDIAVGGYHVDRGRGIVAVFLGPHQGEMSTDDADLIIQGPEGEPAGIGRDLRFMDVGGPPSELVLVSGHQSVPSAPPLPNGNPPFGALHVFTGDQRGQLGVEDARLTVYNDQYDGVLSALSPPLGDMDGDGNTDVMLYNYGAGVIVSLCP